MRRVSVPHYQGMWVQERHVSAGCETRGIILAGMVINLFHAGCKVQKDAKSYVVLVPARTVPSFVLCRP
jgi:hypothetical protein